MGMGWGRGRVRDYHLHSPISFTILSEMYLINLNDTLVIKIFFLSLSNLRFLIVDLSLKG